MEYPKIETLLERDERFNVTDRLRNPVIGTIATWDVTEKINGMNIRVMLSKEGELSFGGRTDNASIPASLLTVLFDMFMLENMKKCFWLNHQPVSAILYGEGYGAGIQKGGGDYNKDKSFRLFDVLIEDKYWMNWENTCDVARKLRIKTVPYLGRWTLEQIIKNVKAGIFSETAIQESGLNVQAEGIVGRTIEPLFDKRGRRVIIKLKTNDFKHK